MGRQLPMTMDAHAQQTLTVSKACAVVESVPISALWTKGQGLMTPGAIALRPQIAFQIPAILTLALLTVLPPPAHPMPSPVLVLRMTSANQPTVTQGLAVTLAPRTERHHPIP